MGDRFGEDTRVSFIVPVYKTEDVLERCLKSLRDQDWPNIEIIVVLDGENEKARKIAKNYNTRIVEIPHSGACAARNAGAKIATGEIWSFFNSDYVARPGMVREWVEAFSDNPDCGFVYGGYEWTDGDAAYMSEEFDPYKLECYNYIDCGSPIRREVFQPWDESCKSLQDWDFFLRLVRSGVKGAYIRSTLYAADKPKHGGLSWDSSHNWIQRVRYVKRNHGIPERDLCVCSYGAQHHALNIAKMLGADYKPNPSMKPNTYRAVYCIGFYPGPRGAGVNSHLSMFSHLQPGCRRIIHWVGADVYWMRALPMAAIRDLRDILNGPEYVHLVESDDMAWEMRDFGLKDVRIVPIPPPRTYEVQPLPEQFTVAAMMTERSDFDKYCSGLTQRIAAGLPQVKFVIFGDKKPQPAPNIEYVGYTDMRALIARTSCLLRIVRHDGPFMAGHEYIMAGRDVISNLNEPYYVYCDTRLDQRNWDAFSPGLSVYHYPETKRAIMQAILDVRDGKLGNHARRKEASDYYRELLDINKFRAAIASCGRGEWVGDYGPTVLSTPDRAPLAVADAVRKYVEGKRFCDVGARMGDLLAAMSVHAGSIVGIELDETCVGACRARGLPVEHGDAYDGVPEADVYWIWITRRHNIELTNKMPPGSLVLVGGDPRVGETYSETDFPSGRIIDEIDVPYDEGEGERKAGVFRVTVVQIERPGGDNA